MRCNAALNTLIDDDAHRMMRVALGQEPAQAVIVNARVVNIYTAEHVKTIFVYQSDFHCGTLCRGKFRHARY